MNYTVGQPAPVRARPADHQRQRGRGELHHADPGRAGRHLRVRGSALPSPGSTATTCGDGTKVCADARLPTRSITAGTACSSSAPRPPRMATAMPAMPVSPGRSHLGGRRHARRGRVGQRGGRQVGRACRAGHGCAKLVHCSSIHAFDLTASAGRPVDEESPRSRRGQLPAYDRSEAAGEVEVRRAVDRGLNAVIVNPTGVIGPRDPVPSRMGVVLRALWRRRLPALVAGGFDWVDVRDAVRALTAAAARGRIGANYVIPSHRQAQPAVRACAPVAASAPADPRGSCSVALIPGRERRQSGPRTRPCTPADTPDVA